MKPAYTPGPWIARLGGSGGWTVEPDDGAPPWTFVLCSRAPWPKQQAASEANAHVIAAAPDLYAAAGAALELITHLSGNLAEDSDDFLRCLDVAAKLGVAVLKAEGSPPPEKENRHAKP